MRLGSIVPGNGNSAITIINSHRGSPNIDLHPAWTELDFDTITISGSNSSWEEPVTIAQISGL